MPFYDVVFHQKYWDDILWQRTIGASVSIYIYIYNYIFLFLFVFDKPSNLALNLQIIKPLDRCELDNEEKRCSIDSQSFAETSPTNQTGSCYHSSVWEGCCLKAKPESHNVCSLCSALLSCALHPVFCILSCHAVSCKFYPVFCHVHWISVVQFIISRSAEFLVRKESHTLLSWIFHPVAWILYFVLYFGCYILHFLLLVFSTTSIFY